MAALAGLAPQPAAAVLKLDVTQGNVQPVPIAIPDFVGVGLRDPAAGRNISQIIASNLSHRLSLPGWRRDAAEILAVSDVFVLTSLWEGLPRALVEAMKSGLPCVCYATDGVRDVIIDGLNGFLVPQGNVSALAERVSSLLRDPAGRRRVGAQAAQSIRRSGVSSAWR